MKTDNNTIVHTYKKQGNRVLTERKILRNPTRNNTYPRQVSAFMTRGMQIYPTKIYQFSSIRWQGCVGEAVVEAFTLLVVVRSGPTATENDDVILVKM